MNSPHFLRCFRRLVFAVMSRHFATAVLAWDPAGHMLVDQIAWETAKPAARAKVSELVATLDLTYNAGIPYHFIIAGCWMDDLRAKKGYAWSKWHYVNIPWTPGATAFALPPPPHVVWAIDEAIKTLKAPGTAPAEAAQALAMLMHFTGDLHQPLHATDRDDRGGNAYLIYGVPFSDLFPHSAANLHTFWDKAYRFDGVAGKIVELWTLPDLASRPSAPGEGVIAAEAAKIMAEFPAAKFPELTGTQPPERWARESYQLGCRVAYPSGEPPLNTEVRTLDAPFVRASHTTAQRRIALAGYRLGALLNELFP